MKKLLLLSALVIAVAGCSFFPSAGDPARKYTLSYTQFAPDVNNLKVRLLIDTPSIYSPLDTLRICLKNSERSLDYFADVEWANRLNSLIHESIVYSFENTGKFPSISRPADGAKVDKVLKLEVRGFYMDFFSEPPQKLARADYSVQIIDKASRNVIATKAFRAQAYVNEDRIEAYVQALNQAHIDATTQMIKWTVTTLKNAKPDDSTDEKESDGGGNKDSDADGEKSGDTDSAQADDSSQSEDSDSSKGGSGGGDGGGSDAGGAMAKAGELKDKAGAMKGAAGGGADKGGDDSSKGESGNKSEDSGKKEGENKSEESDKKESESKSEEGDKKETAKKGSNRKGSSRKK